MLTLKTELSLTGLTGREITDFLLDPRDERYQAWWPGTHLRFHQVGTGKAGDHLGDRVLMDEYVGTRRIRMLAEVIEASPGERIVWRMRRWGLRLPVRLTLTLQTHGDDVWLSHTITAGWTGRAAALDRLWQLYFSPSFADSMERHVHTEFALLRDQVHRGLPKDTATPDSGTARSSVDLP